MGWHRAVMVVLAFASGAAALVYQMVWMRWFQLLFGSTAHAASATLSAFFAGLAIGSEFFGRRSARLRRPLVGYALLEIGAASLALAVPLVFDAYDGLYPHLYARLSQSPGIFVSVKLALAMTVMLPPAILLGGSFPMLVSAYVNDVEPLGRAGTRLYAVNTLGAAVGGAAGSMWLPDWIGVHRTYGLAIALSIGAALIALASSRGRSSANPARAAIIASESDRLRIPTIAIELRAVAFASGFGTLALEVLLVQAIAQRIDHSVYSFGAVLVVVLLCLAAGAQIVSLTASRVQPKSMLSFVLFAEASLLLTLPAMIERYRVVTEAGSLLRGIDAALWLGGPALLVGALVLPLTFRMIDAEVGQVGRQVGGLLAINTLGGILGSIVASFALLAWLGLGPAIAIVGLFYGFSCVVIASDLRARATRGAGLALLVVAVVVTPLDPWGLARVALEPGDRLVDLRESSYGVVSVIDRKSARLMKINNHYTLSGAGPLGSRKERTGHIPLLLHPDPKRVLFVGSATGQTAGAAVVHPVSEIELVEIVPDVQELAARHFSENNRAVHHDPRTRWIVEDGRNHLRATHAKYDVIVADLFSPWRPGVGSLYAREHFEAIRERLAPGGLFCQWIPLYQHREETFGSIAATFLQVFPEARVFRGDFYRSMPRVALIGFAGEPTPIERVNERVRDLGRRGITDRWVVIPRAFWMLYAGPLAALAPELLRHPTTNDANPHFEYLAGRTQPYEIHRFLNQGWPRLSRMLARAASDDPAYRDARHAAADGADLARLNALETSDDRLRHRPEILSIRGRLPSDLIAVADPSAAEMWAH